MNVALHSQPVNIISLCSGGGGLDFGIELAIPGARPVVLVEGEAWSVATLVSAMEARLMAPAPVWSNVRTFDGRPWRGLVDGLIGGIPCQPHSLAGRKGGQNDERDLWSPARRIIAQARPWFVVIENVRGMLSPGDDEIAGAERVWRDLQRLGYAVEAGLFTAAEVGASHERERVFILGVADVDSGGRDSRVGHLQAWQSDVEGRGAWNVGHSDDARLEGRRHEPDERAGERIARQDGSELVDAASDGRGGSRTEPELRSGRNAAAGASLSMGNTDRIGEFKPNHEDGADGRTRSRDSAGRTGSGFFCAMDDTDRERQLEPQGIIRNVSGWTEDAGRRSFFPSLFPPGPSDLDSWRRVLAHSPHLEPAVRRMADGVAARLDLTGPHAARIERLRMLGNGVVWLQAAYAVRTLATRLASRAAGAERFVRMMGQT